MHLLRLNRISECQTGYYGQDCSIPCSKNCDVSRECDRFTGQCNEGCKEGWTGNTCDQGYHSPTQCSLKV